jgi:insulysin
MVAKASPPETPKMSPKEQKDQLVELLFQDLSSTDLDLHPDHFKQHFEHIDLSSGDEGTILSALRKSIGDRLPAQKAEPILDEARKNLEAWLVALKIKAPVEAKEINGTDVAKKSPSPIVIEDVDTWKASMTVSEGPRPINDLSQFEEFEPKL